MMGKKMPMLSKLLASRWRHPVRLIPLGVVVGFAFGLLFQDLLYGLLAGSVIGLLFGLMMAVRNPS